MGTYKELIKRSKCFHRYDENGKELWVIDLEAQRVWVEEQIKELVQELTNG